MSNVHHVRVTLPREVEVRVWDYGDNEARVDISGMMLWSLRGVSAASIASGLSESSRPLVELLKLLKLVEEATEKAALDGRILP